jgi:regulator of replication initiation timing
MNLQEAAFMAEQVQSLLADKHQLQEQVISLQRDNRYLVERNEYLQQQQLDRAPSAALSDDDAVQKMQQELEVQRRMNAQLKGEVQHLCRRLTGARGEGATAARAVAVSPASPGDDGMVSTPTTDDWTSPSARPGRLSMGDEETPPHV